MSLRAVVKKVVGSASRRMAGHHWNGADRQDRRNWWDVDRLVNHVDAMIEDRTSSGDRTTNARLTGVRKVIADASPGGRPFHRAVSVGCGNGVKELALVEAGLVDHFTLFEVSSDRLATARRRAEEAGLVDSFTFRGDDAFSTDPRGHDLVYWDHSLHHMADVDRAVEWSVNALDSGGALVINDYIGANRLQFGRRDHELAVGTVRSIEDALGESVLPVRKKNTLTLLQIMLRDPSEAPQSERILESCRRRCDGWSPEPIGGAMVNICGAAVARSSDPTKAGGILVERDEYARDLGVSHFAFGVWTKP